MHRHTQHVCKHTHTFALSLSFSVSSQTVLYKERAPVCYLSILSRTQWAPVCYFSILLQHTSSFELIDNTRVLTHIETRSRSSTHACCPNQINGTDCICTLCKLNTAHRIALTGRCGNIGLIVWGIYGSFLREYTALSEINWHSKCDRLYL